MSERFITKKFKSEPVRVIRVTADNHTFSRFPFALTVAVPGIESYGDDFEFFDESESSKIVAFALDMGLKIETVQKYYD